MRKVVKRDIKNPCPYPIKGDTGTAEDCILKGHCACNEGERKKPNRISFREQLKHCKEKGFLFTEQYPMAVRYLISCCRIFGGQCMSKKCRDIRAKGNLVHHYHLHVLTEYRGEGDDEV